MLDLYHKQKTYTNGVLQMGKSQKFEINYETETKESPLTSFGGLPIFFEFLKKISFDKIIEQSLPATGNQGYAPIQHILSLILINLTGGESVSDVEELEKDSGLKRLVQQWEKSIASLKDRVFKKGRERLFPSCSRIFGFLDRFNAPNEDQERESTAKGKSKILPISDYFSGLLAINKEIVGTAQRLSPQKVATLDMDNNLVISKKSNAKVSYKKFPSYGPFNVYWDEMDMMLASEFRDGNVPPGFEQIRVFKEALELLPSSVERVYHRSDSAGYQHDLMNFLESGESRFGKIEFAISASVTAEIRSLVRDLPAEEWKPVTFVDENGIEVSTDQEVAEVAFVPTTKNNSKSAPVFRYIVTREAVNIQYAVDDSGQLVFDTSATAEKKLHLEVMDDVAHKVFAIVTNRTEPPLEILLWHRKRCGRSEEEHSRLTADMAGGRFPSDSFGENSAWWMVAILSQNLLKLFQKEALPKKLRRSRLKTLNRVFLRIALKIVKCGTGLKVKIPVGSTLSELIEFAQQKIKEIQARLSDRTQNKRQVCGDT